MDRFFAMLLALQWVIVVTLGWWVALKSAPGRGSQPGGWGADWTVALLASAIVGPPIALIFWRAGQPATRFVVAVAQAMLGALLIHLSGGRIEAHFHVFGSLALLANYRDWRVLIWTSIVVAIDHLYRGLYWPESIFGAQHRDLFQCIEHLAWIVIVDVFLIRSCLINVRGMREEAMRSSALNQVDKGLRRGGSERGQLKAVEPQAHEVVILEPTSDFVGMADENGRPCSGNEAELRMGGITPEELVQTTIGNLPRNATDVATPDESIPASEQSDPCSTESSGRRRKESEIPDLAFSLTLQESDSRFESTSSIAQDLSERQRTEQEIRLLNSRLERRLGRMKLLRQTDQVIGASFDLGQTLSTLLEKITTQLGDDAVDILLLEPGERTLKYAIGRGFRTEAMRQAQLLLDASVCGEVVIHCRPLHYSPWSQAARPFVRAEAMIEEGFVAYSAVPLVSQGVVEGVLEVFHREDLVADQEWLDVLEMVAGQAATAIHHASVLDDHQRLNAELNLAYDATIEGWAQALDLRDKETEGHTRRVTEMSVKLARAMGVPECDLINVRRGALLHDIGKLGVPDSILLKPGELTDAEWSLMRRHPTYAYRWLSPITFLRPALEIPHCHHEKFDGTGYPRGLKGEEIPLSARIFAVVDIWDALRSDRPYRKAWAREQVVEYIRALAGTHLDPKVVAVFLDVLVGDSSGRTQGSTTREWSQTLEEQIGSGLQFCLPLVPAGNCPGEFPSE